MRDQEINTSPLRYCCIPKGVDFALQEYAARVPKISGVLLIRVSVAQKSSFGRRRWLRVRRARRVGGLR